MPQNSEITPDIQNRKETCLTAIPPAFLVRKKSGELWSTNKKVTLVNIDPPKWTFLGRPHFGPLGVLPPQIFTRARD